MPLRRHLPVVAGLLALGVLTISLIALAQLGEANMDNDPSEDDLEAYFEDPSLDAGSVVTDDLDDDGDFDTINFGVRGGGQFAAQAQMDSDGDEVELVISDPTREAGQVRSADADGDGDVEVVWAGTQGADFDGDGDAEPEESGDVIAVIDIDNDGNSEVIVADTSREIGEFEVGSFGFRSGDDIEILWIGILVETRNGRGATFSAILDFDGDGEKEIRFEDIRIEQPMPSFGGVYLDVDGDGDDDVIIE